MGKFDNITDELLSALLDGNVSAAEKNKLMHFINRDDELQEVIDIMADLGLNSQEPINQITINQTTMSAKKRSVSLGITTAVGYSAAKLVQMYNRGAINFHRPAAAATVDHSAINNSGLQIGFAQAETTHGKPELDIPFDPETFQYYNDSCAFQSQAIVLKEYGINVSQEELMDIAKAQGWYVEGYGTPLEKVGKLLEYYNVPTTFTEGNNVFNLSNELAQHHRVIVTVDANEMWHEGILQDMKDAIIGETPNHALVVVGLDTSNPDEVKVIVTDPGNGNLQMAYSEKQFVDAWKDSNCFMAATEVSPEEFINHMSPTHLEEFAGIPFASISRLAEADINGLNEFAPFVSAILENPEDIDEIIDNYPDLFTGDDEDMEVSDKFEEFE